MEVLQVQPRDSYLHYIYVPKKGTSIQWSFSTKRNNIHFGVFKRPNQDNQLNRTSALGSLHADDISAPSILIGPRIKSAASIKLQDQGLIEIIPIQQTLSSQTKVEDSLEVTEPGNYVLVFDNTFSRTTPKLLTFSVRLTESSPTEHPLSGWLLKKKRKKMQGWAKRWFQLTPMGTLSYSTSPTDVARGVIQTGQAMITSQANSWTVQIDSGTITYHLKALNQDDFEKWTAQLKQCRSKTRQEEVDGCEDWIEKRQVDHIGALAKESARTQVARGLHVNQLVKEKLEALHRWIEPEAMSSQGMALLAEFDALVERQQVEWQNIQTTVWQADPFGNGNKTIEAATAVPPRITRLCRFAERVSFNFTEKFYDATDATLEPDDTDEDEDRASTDNQATTDDDDDEDIDWTRLKCPRRRQQLPSPAVGDVKSALAVFRKNVGKDLSSISLPVSMNEPIGMLQRACEELEYSELLDQASALTTAMDRLVYVTTFAISSYTSSQYRTGRKPFNPIMTETYENIRPDKGFRFVSEKVCHNPLTIAAHAESRNYKYWQCTKVKSKFWGKSMEFTTEGVYHVTLTDHDDHYTYSKPSSWIRNMIAGEKYLEHTGEMKVTNQATGEYAIVTFKEGSGGGLFGAPTKRNDIVADFYSADGTTTRRVTGKWSDYLCKQGDDEPIWTANLPGVQDYENYYGLTRFCVEMNEITELEQDKLPITDTRYRPDQRLYERGYAEEADKEKKRIEQKQRDRRHELELMNIPWSPRWFTLQTDPYTDPGFAVPESQERQAWVFNEQYWNARESGRWPRDTFNLW